MHPPWPMFGCMAWTESPSKVTRPFPHVNVGILSYMSLLRIASSSVACMRSTALSHQPSNILSSLSFFPAMKKEDDLIYFPLETPDSIDSSASLRVSSVIILMKIS